MPKLSRYTDKQIEDLLTELITVLENNHTSVDLSLIVLGNMVTHLINNSIAPAQRHNIANSFAEALKNSVKIDNSH